MFVSLQSRRYAKLPLGFPLLLLLGKFVTDSNWLQCFIYGQTIFSYLVLWEKRVRCYVDE